MIINASAHNIPLADKSIHAAITSPPYFGLRKYEGAQETDDEKSGKVVIGH